MWEYILEVWTWLSSLTFSAALNILGFMGVCMAYTLAYNRLKHRGRLILILFTVVVVTVVISGAFFPQSMAIALLQHPLALAFNALLIHGIMAKYSVKITRFLEKFPIIVKLGILPNTSLLILKSLCLVLALPMTLWFATSILLVVYFAVMGFKQTRSSAEEEDA